MQTATFFADWKENYDKSGFGKPTDVELNMLTFGALVSEHGYELRFVPTEYQYVRSGALWWSINRRYEVRPKHYVLKKADVFVRLYFPPKITWSFRVGVEGERSWAEWIPHLGCYNYWNEEVQCLLQAQGLHPEFVELPERVVDMPVPDFVGADAQLEGSNPYAFGLRMFESEARKAALKTLLELRSLGLLEGVSIEDKVND